jgi:P pilus assembly chaperone PapD
MPIKILPTLTTVAALTASSFAIAQPEIHFTEYRIFLNEKNSKADYEIFNQGQSDADCTASFADYNVAKDGTLSLVKENETKPEFSAEEILKVSPRKVRINSMSSQKLKIFAKRLRSQPEQEWVSYLELVCKTADIKLKAGININPNFRYHIPVVVRHGNLDAEVKIENASITQEGNNSFANLTLAKTGSRSLYGSVIAVDADGTELGKRTGISHYLQTEQLDLKIPLSREPIGEVSLTFEENKQYGGNLKKTVTVR